jgi:two-component system LytT family response regulator
MKPISTLIVDDEAPARRWIQTLCGKQADIYVAGACSTASHASQMLRAGGIDLLLLDVQLGPFTGFQVLEGLSPSQVPLVIFVTAFDQYAVKAFEKNAVDYLLKPVAEERFDRAIERVRRQLQKGLTTDLRAEIREALAAVAQALDSGTPEADSLDRLIAQRDGAFHPLPVQKIELLQSNGNYVDVYTSGDPHPFRLRGTLHELMEQLDPQAFLRISRSHVVNLAHVERIEPNATDGFMFTMTSPRQLAVGRSYRHTILQFLRAGGRQRDATKADGGMPPSGMPPSKSATPSRD